jgi:hypothetical protein
MRNVLAAAVLAAFVGLAHTSSAFAWGAIVVDHDYGEDPEDSGYVMLTQKHRTSDAAASEALLACQDNGDHCEVVLKFQKCGAYAASKTNFGVGAAMSLKQAERRAVASCKGAGCRVVVSDCQ